MQTIFIGIGIAIGAWLLQQFFSNKSKISTLEKSESSLMNDNSKLQAEIKQLQKQMSEYESKILIYENQKTILAQYTHDKNFDKFGYLINKKTKKPFCIVCLHDDPLKEIPLKPIENYTKYFCPICKTKYDGDSNKPPRTILEQYGDMIGNSPGDVML